MPEIELFPVICTADISILLDFLPDTKADDKAVDKFLSEAQAASEQLVPGTSACLAVLTTADGTNALPTCASQPPLQPFTSPFLGQSINDVARHPILRGAAFFAVLDERSARDGTALLAIRNRDDNSVRTVRATFSAAQQALIALDIGTLGFDEVESIAAQGIGGVYGAPAPGQGRQRGKPAPPMKLGE